MPSDEDREFLAFGLDAGRGPSDASEGPLFNPGFFLRFTSTDFREWERRVLSAAPTFHECLQLACGYWDRDDEVRFAFPLPLGPVIEALPDGLTAAYEFRGEVATWRDSPRKPRSDALCSALVSRVYSVAITNFFRPTHPDMLASRIQLRDQICASNERIPPPVEHGDPLRWKLGDLLTDEARDRIERLEDDAIFGVDEDARLADDVLSRTECPVRRDESGLHVQIDPSLTVLPHDRVRITIHDDGTADVDIDRQGLHDG